MSFSSTKDSNGNDGSKGDSNNNGGGGNNNNGGGGNNNGGGGNSNDGNSGGQNHHKHNGNDHSAQTSPYNLTESDLGSLFLSPGNKPLMVNDMAPTVSYSEGWDFSIIQEASKPPPGHTFHSTGVPNSHVDLPFQGSQIYVFGLLPPGNGPLAANFSIDGGPPQSRAVDASTSSNSFIGNETLFVSPMLDYGNHNISIVITQTGKGRNYTLDYFYVIQPDGSKSMAKDSDGKGPSDTQPRKSNTGAIVGGVLGAFAFLLLLALFFFFWKRRRTTQPRLRRDQPQMAYYGQSNAGETEPRNLYPYPFAPTWDSSTTSQSRLSWPIQTSHSSRFPPPSIDPPTVAPSVVGEHGRRDSMRSAGSAGSWHETTALSPASSTTKNSSMEAQVSHFSLYSSQKSISTMQFSQPTPPPPRARVPPTLQPLEPVPQGDFDRFTTTSSVRDLGRAL